MLSASAELVGPSPPFGRSTNADRPRRSGRIGLTLLPSPAYVASAWKALPKLEARSSGYLAYFSPPLVQLASTLLPPAPLPTPPADVTPALGAGREGALDAISSGVGGWRVFPISGCMHACSIVVQTPLCGGVSLVRGLPPSLRLPRNHSNRQFF